MMTAQQKLTATQVQSGIREILQRAASQDEAERAALAAAVAIIVTSRGPVLAVELFRDLADVIEHDVVLDAQGPVQ